MPDAADDDRTVNPLVTIGWDAGWASAFDAARAGRDDLVAARISQTDRGEATVWLGAGAEARVRMASSARRVVAGDWVAVDPRSERIEIVLPRRAALVRRSARGARTPQTLAANPDVVAVVQAVDHGLSARRLERELVLAHQSGATPLVVLTKADLIPDAGLEAAAEARTLCPGVDVIVASPATGVGMDALAERLEPGKTFALLGASGVGKSSIVNRLSGAEVQLTAGTRLRDGKGRHTTTAARLVLLGGGQILLDTPGVRALALWNGVEGLSAAFPEIARATQQCRFDDCHHDGEPGCAVGELVTSRLLSPERLSNWRRMTDELAELDDDLARG